MHVPDDDGDEMPQINIVPMIDVVFALLTFFMMASLYLSRPQGLDINLPEASTAGTQTESEINITISPDGNIALNQQPIAVEQLPAAIRAIKGDSPTAFVVISGDVEVNYGRVIAVMDQLRSIEGVKIGVATQ
ncbi:ExbD/TolR family protein [Leptolyngbya sp. 7M]|uniref:ExbD/TolR family protein n=1 Tax=Leptolyngbya sp. 7M TaxID=2812896 RepID=UPI001B8D25BB|nr:biopolymer transporter ExbD [Leptolyngbya sp. 7M]QYO63558.1 biopolymer transporter ExbD [Leptolyngbya sp. 7M]